MTMPINYVSYLGSICYLMRSNSSRRRLRICGGVRSFGWLGYMMHVGDIRNSMFSSIHGSFLMGSLDAKLLW